MYRALRRALFLVAPERIHTWVFAFLRGVTAVLPVRRGLARWLAPHDPVLASTVFGVRFAGPLGLAAGFDKDGRGLRTWGALGFGYAEVGTVTAQAQPGDDVDEIADLAVELGLAGIVATNTTVSRSGLATPGADSLGAGGISGPPVAQRSAEVLRRLYRRVGDRLVLISVGGIET